MKKNKRTQEHPKGEPILISLPSPRDQEIKILIEEYNTQEPDPERRKDIIKKLFGVIGDNFTIDPPFICNHGKNIHIGNNFSAGRGCIFADERAILIGNNVMLGANVGIYTYTYPDDNEEDNRETTAPVIIGNDTWIGENTIILPGIIIGRNAIICTGSTVFENVPENAIARGNPAKVVDYIDTGVETELD